MSLPTNLRCPIDIMHPRPVGISDRSGFLVFLDTMEFQYQWNATSLYNTRILVPPDELDVPAEFLRTPIFGPEPAPLPNARPAHWAQQSQGGEPPINSINEILP